MPKTEGMPPGEARLSGGYRLPASHVIHTAGPLWLGGAAGEHRILENCYRSCIGIARTQGFRDIAFPAIATGLYGFPREAAARIAVTTVAKDLADEQLPELVIFVCFDLAHWTLTAMPLAIEHAGIRRIPMSPALIETFAV
jgi:O-acetyl-ADP-ribose deacetylase (regulator of RNase III)